MTIEIRTAVADDGTALAELLNEIIDIGGTTAFLTPFDAEAIRSKFIELELGISCVVAERRGEILGFQTLEWCDPSYTGPEPLPLDWALISSFVRNGHGRKGIAHRLFDTTFTHARTAGVSVIDATIRADNASGLGYYDAIGFVDFQRLKDVPLADGSKVDRVRKRLDLGNHPGK